MPNLENVLKDALILDERDRATLAERLLESLDDGRDLPDDEAGIALAWADEAQRRLEELESGKAKAIPADEVHAKAAKLLR